MAIMAEKSQQAGADLWRRLKKIRKNPKHGPCLYLYFVKVLKWKR
jgi:hypothetical protein